MKELAEYFHKLRMDEKHHLGLGDIRLTIGQQDEICTMVANFISSSPVLTDSLPLSSTCEYYQHGECDCIDGFCHDGGLKR